MVCKPHVVAMGNGNELEPLHTKYSDFHDLPVLLQNIISLGNCDGCYRALHRSLVYSHWYVLNDLHYKQCLVTLGAYHCNVVPEFPGRIIYDHSVKHIVHITCYIYILSMLWLTNDFGGKLICIIISPVCVHFAYSHPCRHMVGTIICLSRMRYPYVIPPPTRSEVLHKLWLFFHEERPANSLFLLSDVASQ